MELVIILFLFFCLPCSLFLSLVSLISFLNRAWLKPIMIQSSMSRQGVNGPPYRFLHGNTKEINHMRNEALGTSMELLSHHQLLPRIMPHVYSWTKIHGMNFLNWYGTRPQLVITDPELVKEVLSNKEGAYPKKFIQSYAKKFLGNSILSSQGEKWVKTRKLANQAFHGGSLKAMIPAMIHSVEVMLQRWRDVKEVDAFQEFKLLTSEVISRTAFGSSYVEGKNVFDMLTKLGLIVNRNNFKVSSIPGLDKLWRTSDDIESDKLEQAIKEAIIELIRKREGRGGHFNGSDDDFLGSLLNAFHDSDLSRKITIDDVVDECKAFYVGGHETITSSLTWTVFLLAIHTDWQDKARKEVTELLDQHNPITLDGVSRLKQMAMVVNESLRLYPPVFNLTREVEKETKLGNYIFPANMALSLPILAIHHNPLLWGEDCHLFKPERFAERFAADHGLAKAFLPFGSGPRTCVGLNFAAAEIKIALSMILRRYRFSLSPSYVHAPFNMLTIRPKHGLQILLHPL
ncbi:unnamed protein product [Linum tenue]|uniref:Cytochrome P450 n=1 Tax=Linum tenue TaxID=586396 RepID=A0AAV0L1Z8_9ROSI|nr:unnamed protein product [Linum tenue]